MSVIRKDLLGVWQFSVLQLLSCVFLKSIRTKAEDKKGDKWEGSHRLFISSGGNRDHKPRSQSLPKFYCVVPSPNTAQGNAASNSCFTMHNVKTSPLGGSLQMVWFLLTYCPSQTCLPQACKHEVRTDLLRKKDFVKEPL